MIVNYLNVEEKLTLPPECEDKVIATTLWYAVDDTLQDTTVSGPFFCLGSTRFTFLSHSCIRGLVINNICNEQPTEEIARLAHLWCCPSDIDSIAGLVSCAFCGYWKAAIISSPSQMGQTYLLSYSWSNYNTGNYPQPTSVYLEKECFILVSPRQTAI